MRFLAVAALVAAMLVPAASASAETMCQTPNGIRSLSQVTSELVAAGYPGPWNLHAMTGAYSKAAGGATNCGADAYWPNGDPSTPDAASSPSLAPAPTGHPTVLVELGGIGTDGTPGGPWPAAIEPFLGTAVQFRRYSYASCGDLDANIAALAQYVESLRPNRVILVGHSMGGVLALDATGEYGLSDVVRGVVVADAPLGGLSVDRVNFGESVGAVPSPCAALEHMENPAWAAYSAKMADQILSNGTALLDISNQYDNVVPLASQQLPQTVNQAFAVSNGAGLLNHSAVFSAPAAMAAVIDLVRSLLA